MRVIHAVLAGLLLGAIIGWWQLGHPGYETEAQHQARIRKAFAEPPKPQLYRWRDDAGVLQLTSTPPKGRPYEKVEMREDVNVIPMSVPEKKPKKGGK